MAEQENIYEMVEDSLKETLNNVILYNKNKFLNSKFV
jgi:hypothetical protein